MIQQRGASQAHIEMFPGAGGTPSNTLSYQNDAAPASSPSSYGGNWSTNGGTWSKYDSVTPPEQLKMFMSPNEVHAKYQPLDADRESYDAGSGWNGSSSQQYSGQDYDVEDDDQLWDRKREEASSDGLYDSIEAGGVRKPISLGTQFGSMGKKEIVGGHHRIAVQTEVDADRLMPVLHHEDIWDARSPETRRAGFEYT